MNRPLVPFLQINPQDTSPLLRTIEENVIQVVRGNKYILGEQLSSLEQELAAHEQTKLCVGVGSGLDAITILLRALGIGPGDEVIVPAFTFIATWFGVTHAGATLVPVDVNPGTANIDLEAAQAAITSRTVAILGVNLYGRPVDFDGLELVSERSGILLLTDAAQSFGAETAGVRVMSRGTAATTSFYPGKNLGAFGDAGAVFVNDLQIADRMKVLRNYGSVVKYRHEALGLNSRLDELQAIVLRTKLPHVDAWNRRRAEIAERYTKALTGSEFLSAPSTSDSSVWHLYVIRTRNRSSLREWLRSRGIETIIHYPTPPYRQLAYQDQAFGRFPVSDALSEEVLSLPIGPHMSDTQVDYVIDSIHQWTPS